MAKLVYGERIGKHANIRVGCSAMIFDDTRQKVLLTRRTDNGRWCLPGGGVDSGESAEEACVREVWEETGLRANVTRLIGIYTNPHFIVEYEDGNQHQIVALSFQVEVTGGKLGISNETTDAGYFSREEMKQIDVMEHHLLRIDDAFQRQDAAFIR